MKRKSVSLMLQGESEHWKAIYVVDDKTLIDSNTIENSLHADFKLTFKGTDIFQINSIHYLIMMKDGTKEEGTIFPQEVPLKIKERQGQTNLDFLLSQDTYKVVTATIEWDGQSETFDMIPPKTIGIKRP